MPKFSELKPLKWWLELKKKDETLLGWQKIKPLYTVGNLIICQTERMVSVISAQDLEAELLEEIYIPEYGEYPDNF